MVCRPRHVVEFTVAGIIFGILSSSAFTTAEQISTTIESVDEVTEESQSVDDVTLVFSNTSTTQTAMGVSLTLKKWKLEHLAQNPITPNPTCQVTEWATVQSDCISLFATMGYRVETHLMVFFESDTETKIMSTPAEDTDVDVTILRRESVSAMFFLSVEGTGSILSDRGIAAVKHAMATVTGLHEEDILLAVADKGEIVEISFVALVTYRTSASLKAVLKRPSSVVLNLEIEIRKTPGFGSATLDLDRSEIVFAGETLDPEEGDSNDENSALCVIPSLILIYNFFFPFIVPIL